MDSALQQPTQDFSRQLNFYSRNTRSRNRPSIETLNRNGRSHRLTTPPRHTVAPAQQSSHPLKHSNPILDQLRARIINNNNKLSGFADSSSMQAQPQKFQRPKQFKAEPKQTRLANQQFKFQPSSRQESKSSKITTPQDSSVSIPKLDRDVSPSQHPSNYSSNAELFLKSFQYQFPHSAKNDHHIQFGQESPEAALRGSQKTHPNRFNEYEHQTYMDYYYGRNYNQTQDRRQNISSPVAFLASQDGQVPARTKEQSPRIPRLELYEIFQRPSDEFSIKLIKIEQPRIPRSSYESNNTQYEESSDSTPSIYYSQEIFEQARKKQELGQEDDYTMGEIQESEQEFRNLESRLVSGNKVEVREQTLEDESPVQLNSSRLRVRSQGAVRVQDISRQLSRDEESEKFKKAKIIKSPQQRSPVQQRSHSESSQLQNRAQKDQKDLKQDIAPQQQIHKIQEQSVRQQSKRQYFSETIQSIESVRSHLGSLSTEKQQQFGALFSKMVNSLKDSQQKYERQRTDLLQSLALWKSILGLHQQGIHYQEYIGLLQHPGDQLDDQISSNKIIINNLIYKVALLASHY